MSGSVSAAEMFGAALSEVDQYELVDLATVPPIAVRGGAANDVVHVLSELLDNAISESEPDRGVSLTSSAGEPEWLIEITDSGPGLDEEALDRANARLVDPPEADVEATRRMGLHVVASLAQRHGLRVCLRSASSGGLTASVLVPAALVEPLPDGEPARADPLARDQPTVRLRAYQDLLSQWERTINREPTERGAVAPLAYQPGDAPVTDPALAPGVRSRTPVPWASTQGQVPLHGDAGGDGYAGVASTDPPTLRNRSPIGSVDGVNSTNGAHEPEAAADAVLSSPRGGELDLDGGVELVEYEGSPRFDSVGGLLEREHHAELVGNGLPQAPLVISREPVDVRLRMAGLCDGVRRARRELRAEYADRQADTGHDGARGAAPDGEIPTPNEE